VATPDPLYVLGHFNAPTAVQNKSSTTGTFPAALMADSITILSSSWKDNQSWMDFSQRQAVNTTVNAGVIAGIVPSDGTYYSGGVENFFRFLEDWSGNAFTFNGSMVCLYPSEIAIAPWGASDVVYIPPSTRRWKPDANFNTSSKLPASTPEVRTLIRGGWTLTSANSIN
jgi:hypothetical protein